MQGKVFLLFTILAFLLASSVTAPGASVVKMSLPEMTQQAHAVVIGTITDVQSDWASDRHQIFTTITLNVSESLKGAQSGEITFRQLGGVVGDVRASVAGFPRFVEGTEVLLFLNNDPAGYIPTIGLGQGKFDLYVDDSSGEKMITNDVVGLESPSGLPLTSVDTIRMTLDDMKAAINQALLLEDKIR